MAVIAWIFSLIVSLWPLLALGIIIVLTTKLLLKSNPQDDWAIGMAEIKPALMNGNSDWSGKNHFNIQYENHYKALKGLRYAVWYEGSPIAFGMKKFFVIDPDLALKIQITDFDHFTDGSLFGWAYTERMGNVFGLADANGDLWRSMRKPMNPPFSLPKIRKFMDYYNTSCKEMTEFVEEKAKAGEIVECEDFIKRATINIMALVGFGINANTFKDKNSEFKKQVDAMNMIWRWIMVMMMPTIAGILKIGVYDPKAEAWFLSLISKNIEERKKNDAVAGKDILGTIVQLHEENPQEVTRDALNKTMLQFIFDGASSLADVTSGVLALIVTHTEVQDKLRGEIDEVFDGKDDGDMDLSDTDVTGMHYLDSVILEANRLLTIGATSRKVTKAWKIPDTDIILPVGTGIVIPTSSWQKDPEFWDNPNGFNPDRFNSENKGKIKSGAYQPFGQGPRQCLGNVYAKFKMKLILIYLLRFFTFENSNNLPRNFFQDLDPKKFASPKGGLSVKFHKRDL